MKRIFLISLLLIFFSVAAVSAAQNTTDDFSPEILTDDEKQDLNITIDYPDEVVKDKSKYDYYPSQVNLKNIPYDFPIESYDVYVDNRFEKTMYVNAIVESDEHAIKLSNLDYGEHVISINITGNEKYNPAILTHHFKLIESKITIPDEMVMGSYTSGSLRADTDATGYLIVNVNGALFKKSALKMGEEASTATVDLSTLNKMGTYEIEAIYTGDSKYKQNSLKKTVNVTYMMILSLDYHHQGPVSYYIYKKEHSRLRIFLPSDVKNTPTLSINGEYYPVYKNEDNDFEVNVTNCPMGTHEVIATYPGDDKYPQRTITDTMNVFAKIENPQVFNEYKSNIVLRLPEDAKGNLTLYVDNEFFTSVQVKNGTAKIPLDLKVNRYWITASYDGSDYEVDNETFSILIKPKITYHEMTYGETQTVFVEMHPDSNGNLTYMDKQEKLTLVNGKANFTIDTAGFKFDLYPSWDDKEVWLEYVDENGQEWTIDFNIHIKRIPSKLVAKDITMYYGESKSYSLKVWGDYGKVVGHEQEVEIKIGSKTQYMRTNKNGIVTFKANMVPGTYKITASYHGAKITTKITVKQPLSLKTVKVKRSAKKLVLQATLKKGKTPMKYKAVTFKFNGKTFKAKTDKKGIAKVTVKSSILKKLKAGKKIVYSATYGKDTVKKTAKVLK